MRPSLSVSKKVPLLPGSEVTFRRQADRSDPFPEKAWLYEAEFKSREP
jgi:hypothetical protein